MANLRNPMEPADVRTDTEYEITHTFTSRRGIYDDKTQFRSTVAYVNAIKPCGCEGPSLGSVQTTPPPMSHKKLTYLPPRAWRPANHGYELKHEAKGRIGIYLRGERLFGKLLYGAEGNDKLTQDLFRRLAFNHYRHSVIEANRPRNPDGRLCETLKEALEYRPRASCKLWAIYPERPYRCNRKYKPVGYVWGKDAAAKALHNWWVAKNEMKAAA